MVSKETILVTGGAGFIGSNFIRQVMRVLPRTSVVCLDVLTYAGNRDNLAGLPAKRLTFIRGNITDLALMTRLFAKYQPTYVVNCAAETHVDRSIHGQANVFLRSNVLGTGTLLDAARQAPWLKKFVQVSTDEVYGSLSLNSRRKFFETDPLHPNSPYAASKAAADLLALSYASTYALPVVVTRCSNNYGPFQYPEKLIPFSFLRLYFGKPITLYGDGRYVRDWIHVEDHCAALLQVLLKGRPGEIYNIGASDEVNNRTIAGMVAAHFDRGSEAIAYVADRPGHDRRYAIDARKIRRELGFKPRHRLRTSLPRVLSWYAEHTDWTRRTLARGGKVNPHIA